MSGIRAVVARHIREMLRERRTLLGLVAVPIAAGIVLTASRDQLVQQVGAETDLRHEIAVAGAANAPDLMAELAAGPFELKPVPDARALVRDGATPVGIEIPQDFERELTEGRATSIAILIGRRTLPAQLAQVELARAVDGYAQEILRDRLQDQGLPPSLARPIRIEAQDVASAEERARSLLADFLPFMLIIQIVAGMAPIAVDATAGEKERRTLEALLSSPLSRREILAGKWAVTALFGIVAGSLTIASVVLTLRALSGAGGTAVPWDGIGLSLLGAALIAVLISIVQIAIGVAARSTQQAGVLMAPLVFLAIAPAGFLVFDQRITPPGDFRFLIPALGPVVLIRAGLIGEHTATGIVISVAATVVYGVIALWIADRLFRSERALARVGA